ncbi:MAG: major capsid protein [Gemmatimonadaceae bacterium]
MDIGGLINGLIGDGTIARLAINPRAQFGTPTRRYIGAEILPERLVDVNQFIEDKISWRTVVANDGSRYSAVQKKGSTLTGSFPVNLADQDIGSELTGRDYDQLVKLMQGVVVQNTTGSVESMAAIVQMTNWVDATLNLPLVEKIEKARWEALVHARVTLTGDNNYEEVVNYPSIPELRLTATDAWTLDATDPFVQIFALAQAMSDHGITPNRFIMGRSAFSKLANNATVRARVGRAVLTAAGQLRGTTGRATLQEVNGQLQQDALPTIELYDLQYRTQEGSGFFLDRDAAVLIGTTGRNETIDLGDGQFETIEDTLGYAGVGRAAGQGTPGRVIKVYPKDNKPPRVDGEAWQTSLPIITEPEAVASIVGIR